MSLSASSLGMSASVLGFAFFGHRLLQVCSDGAAHGSDLFIGPAATGLPAYLVLPAGPKVPFSNHNYQLLGAHLTYSEAGFSLTVRVSHWQRGFPHSLLFSSGGVRLLINLLGPTVPGGHEPQPVRAAFLRRFMMAVPHPPFCCRGWPCTNSWMAGIPPGSPPSCFLPSSFCFLCFSINDF